MSLTADGFSRPRLPEIKSDYDQRMTDALGPVNTAPDAVIGQLEGIWAEGLDNSYEALQNTYDSMYPYSAEGTSLDGAVAFVGLSRIPAAATVVTACAYGVEGTVVPINSLAHADIQYFSTSDVIISRANALDVTIEVGTVANSATYNIYAGGASSTYTSSVAATKSEIVSGLAALVNSSLLTAVASGETLRIYATDGESPFSITVDAKLNITKRGSPVVFVATQNGNFPCPVGALSNIDTPIVGWDSLFNLKAGATGRNTESDTELRARHATSVRAVGSATVEAIKSRMLAEVESVTSVRIYENRTMVTTSDGIPAKSFETVVVGGVDSAIAKQLWLTKPAGIETFGNVTINVIDSAGDAQQVSFSRPVPQYAWMKVQVTALNTEEVLPTTAMAAIKQAVVDYANSNIGVSDDIIIQRFYGPIYSAVPGIASMTITAAITPTPSGTPSYVSTNIAIGRAENAVFDVSRVTVTGI